MSDRNLPIRWAKKVPQELIWRLYQNDAKGLHDETLIDEVGLRLFLRCESLVMVNGGQVNCPQCGNRFQFIVGTPAPVRPCPQCGWTTSRIMYKHSHNTGDLNGARAISAFLTFVDRYPQAATPRERVLLIDRLIHAFHHGLRRDLVGADIGHRAAANNLINGSHENVVAFLDRLTYGENGTPELKQTQEAWHQESERMRAARQA